MIRAASWCSPANCGVVTLDGAGDQWSTRPLLSNDELTKIIGRTIKYLSRMTGECRNSLCAAGLAMKPCGWLPKSQERPENRSASASRLNPMHAGLLAAGYEGCLAADQTYFRDYLASGRSLGRGNLFIYTLPTSTPGELAIALTLTGPSMHIEESANPLAALSRHANQMIADGEADAMLGIWSDATTSICLAIDGATGTGLLMPDASNPAAMALRLASLSHESHTHRGESSLVPSPGTLGEG